MITRENGTGPNAFGDKIFPNQYVWDINPEAANRAVLESLEFGGFDTDCIRREVGNWEGQVMAIRAGLVDGLPYDFRGPDEPWIDVWRINDAGRAFLRSAGKPAPTMLPARDDWHRKGFEYCAYEIMRDGQPMLRLFKESYPCGANWGMDPILKKEDVQVLQKYLVEWLARHV